jgi:hypothetical protein
MRRLAWLTLIAFTAAAQPADPAADLLRKLGAVAEATTSWRAEIVEDTEFGFPGAMNRGHLRFTVAANAPLKMRRQNSGDDRTSMVCDGKESFHSPDGRSYTRGAAAVNPNCNYTLSWFYNLEPNPVSVTIVGRDRVQLDAQDRPCTLLRVEWRRDDLQSVRTFCVDDEWTVALREVDEGQKATAGARMRRTLTFVSFERNPRFAPGTFAAPQ